MYNKWMYLWNTEDLYIDWWELSWDWQNAFLDIEDCRIYDTRDSNILEDNSDMLPWRIIYGWKEYQLLIQTFTLQWTIDYRLKYSWEKYMNGTKVKIEDIFVEIHWNSINELIRRFNVWKNQTGFPEEIQYVY